VVASSSAELYRQASADQRAAIDAAIEKALAPALTAETAADLWRFLDLYGFHPAANKARRELVSRAMAVQPSSATTTAKGRTPTRTEALWILQQLARSADAAEVRWATAQKAMLFAAAGRTHDAAAAYRRLRDEFAEQVCLEGKTGKRLVDELPADSPLRRELAGEGSVWPTGELNTETLAGPPTSRSLWPVPLEGKAAWVKKTALHFNPTANKLLARDSFGQPLWELQLETPTAGVSHTVSLAMASGHLLFVQTGDEVLAIDVLLPSRPAILWRRPLAEGPLGRGQTAGLPAGMGWNEVLVAQLGGAPESSSGRIGFVTSRCACLQHEETLTALDPLTGRLLWSRRGMPSGNVLFGDDEAIVVSASGADKATLLRAADGEIIGRPTLTPSSILGAVGSRVVIWESRDGKQVLRLEEARGEVVQRLGEFPTGSKVALVDDESAAVLKPDGELTILRLADGQVEMPATKLKPPLDKLERLRVERSGDTYFVAISRPEEDRERAWSFGPTRLHLPGDDATRPTVNGVLYALSRTGEQLWKDGPNRVEGLSWALDQPSDLPVLVFLSDERLRGGGQIRIKLVDRRTGRTLYDHRRPGAPDTVEISGDAKEGVVLLQLPGGRVHLKFGAKPQEMSPTPKTGSEPAAESPKK
jgi:outer membrane protein assembly factor BamB